MNKRLLTIKGHFLPYRSAATPKRILPTDLNMSTRVMPQVMSATDLSKVSAKSLAVRDTVKKSNASQVCRRQSVCKQDCFAAIPVEAALCHTSLLLVERLETYPGEESNSEKGPMMGGQHRQEFEWIRKLGHRRLQGGEPAAQVLGDGHAMMRRFIGKQSMTTGTRGRAIVGGRLFVIRHLDVRLHTIQIDF